MANCVRNNRQIDRARSIKIALPFALSNEHTYEMKLKNKKKYKKKFVWLSNLISRALLRRDRMQYCALLDQRFTLY